MGARDVNEKERKGNACGSWPIQNKPGNNVSRLTDYRYETVDLKNDAPYRDRFGYYPKSVHVDKAFIELPPVQ